MNTFRLLLVTALLSPTLSNAGDKPIFVIAHRGAHREAPENTLAALQQAIDLSCDYVEVDVRETKDGRLVIMHDSTVDRTTNGRGKVADLTLAEIRALNAGVRRGSKFAGEKVPTFDEILDLAKGRMKIYVDHKSAPPQKVLAAIQQRKMLADVIVYGSVDVLREYKRLAPSVWIMPDHPQTIEGIRRLATDLKPETLDGSIVRWTREQVDASHQAGIEVWVDNIPTLDNAAGIRVAVTLGVDAIQTDDPATVLRELAKLGRRPAAAAKKSHGD